MVLVIRAQFDLGISIAWRFSAALFPHYKQGVWPVPPPEALGPHPSIGRLPGKKQQVALTSGMEQNGVQKTGDY